VHLQQYAAHAISHIEVFTIERGALLAIAAGYEYASKRLRRWAIFAALRAYMIAKRVDARSSGGYLASRDEPEGEDGAGKVADGAADEDKMKPRGSPDAVGLANITSSAAASPQNPLPEDLATKESVSVLATDVAQMRTELAALSANVSELLRRIPPPSLTGEPTVAAPPPPPPDAGTWRGLVRRALLRDGPADIPA
jgi:hypothetical protein